MGEPETGLPVGPNWLPSPAPKTTLLLPSPQSGVGSGGRAAGRQAWLQILTVTQPWTKSLPLLLGCFTRR